MKKICIAATVVMLLALPVHGFSKTFAFLLAKDELIKIDTETDSIITKVKSSSELEGFIGNWDSRAVDIGNKYLLAIYEHGDVTGRPGFNVYDLQTLNKIKFVAIPELIKEPLDMKIIYPQKGTKFYVEVEDTAMNNGQGGFVNFAYDKKTHAYLGSVDNLITDRDERFWLSEDHSEIYVKTEENNLRVHDSPTLKLVNTIDLSNIYASNLWGKSILDIKNGVVLLGENKKLQKTDKNNYSFLTYNITNGTTTPRFTTGIDDKASLLTPDAKKVIINEALPITSSGAKAPKKGPSATGRIHVYDVATGKKLGMVSLPTDFGEKILGIKPTSDKLYYLLYSRDESKIRLFVVNLTTLKIIKELTVPNLYFMVFFEG